MSARDELEDIITRAVNDGLVGYDVCMPHLEIAVAVDDILAAGYSKPRTISTVEELDALPDGSVILDPLGLSLHKSGFTGWRASNGAKNISAEMLQHDALPATVLHTPKES